MRLFLMLLGVAQVLDAGYITWEVMQVPLVFGEDVRIRCTYHNDLSCTDPIIWTWNIGTGYDLIMNNGILVEKYKNQTKYSEIRSSCSQYSTLEISHFNETDYNQLYICRIANIDNNFGNYLDREITFGNTSYKYTPLEETIVTDLQIKNQQILYKAQIKKIYPLPECKMYLSNIDITTTFDVQDNKTGLFYDVSVTSTIKSKSLAAIRNLCIICNGNGYRWFLTKQFDPYCTVLTFTRVVGEFFRINTIITIVCMNASCIWFGLIMLIKILRLNISVTGQCMTRKQRRPYRIIKSYLMIGVIGTTAYLGAFKGFIEDGSGKPCQLECGIEIFSVISIAVLMSCSITVFIVTILAYRKSTQKSTKLCHIVGIIYCLFVAVCLVIGLVQLWTFNRKWDIHDVSFQVYLIPCNLILYMVYRTIALCSWCVLNQPLEKRSDEKYKIRDYNFTVYETETEDDNAQLF